MAPIIDSVLRAGEGRILRKLKRISEQINSIEDDFVAMSDADCNLDYLMQEQIIAGDVDEVLRRLLALIEETGPFGTLVLMSYDWDDKVSWVRSTQLFARELMPALNKALQQVTV